jgi:virginiamycin B lyase
LIVAALAASGQALPEGEGKDLVEAVCTACHEASNFTTKRMTKPQWQAKVLEMLQECPDVTQQEREKIVDYLAKNFPAPQK